MFCIYKPEELFQMKKNKFVGTVPTMIDSRISFAGERNLLYCDEGVKLENCNICFAGDDSVVYLSENKYSYKVKIWLYNESTVAFGKNNYMNHTVSITASENKNVIVGSECFFSTGNCIRNSDAHLLYDLESKRRINAGKSVYIGDHVWIGQDVMLLKGAYIASGAVLGAKSVLSNKNISSNTVWAGNPAKQIRQRVIWDGRCVHGWTQELTEAAVYYNEACLDRFYFQYNPEEYISYDEIERRLTERNASEEKLELLRVLSANVRKNRFTSA